jgi:hypothetical protein
MGMIRPQRGYRVVVPGPRKHGGPGRSSLYIRRQSMRILWTLVLTTLAAIPALASPVESTTMQPISHVLYDGTNDYLYVVGIANWGATSCPGAVYVQVGVSVAGRKQLMAVVLAAKAAGQSVRFQGTCNSNANYFDATYIDVQ